MTTTNRMLLGASAWAAAMIAAAWAFKGNPLGDWIDGALLVGFITWLSVRASCGERQAAPTRQAGRS